MENLVDDSEVTDTEFIKTRKRSCQGFELDTVDISSQPPNALHDTLGNRFVELIDVTDCGVKDSKVHRGYAKPSFVTTSSNG